MIISLAMVLIAQNEKVLDLSQTQAIAGAIMGVVELGKAQKGLLAEASGFLVKPAERLATLGNYDGAGNFSFGDPDSAEKAARYVKGVEVTSAVNRCFAKLRTDIVVYRASINEAYRPETEVKVPSSVMIWTEHPKEYRYFKTLASAYGIDWGVNEKKLRSGGKPLPEDLVEKCHTVIEFWDAFSKIPETRDTAMVSVYKRDIKSKAEVGFSKGAELFRGYLLSDSVFQIYNIYGETSPFKAKIEDQLKDLQREADFFYKYLTQGTYLFQKARKELVTNPDGSQSIKETAEKRGTRWEFVQWFLPDLVDITVRTMKVFGKTLK